MQTPLLTGRETADSAPYNKDEDAGADADHCRCSAAKENAALIQSVLKEISLPPIKPSVGGDNALNVAMLPPFDPKTTANYPPAESKLRAPIDKVRVVLWAYTRLPEPVELKKDVAEKRKEFGNVRSRCSRIATPTPPMRRIFKRLSAMTSMKSARCSAI